MAKPTTPKPTTPKTTTARRGTAGKTTAKTVSKTTTKPALVKAAKPVAAIVDPVEPLVSQPELKKPELVDKAVEMSGIKKRFAKPAIEAALAILGEALKEGRDLNLQPLGKVMAKNTKETGSGTVINARIRQSKRVAAEAKAALADPAE